jgi:Spy/CpxP family protein refolding chaperone
MTRSIRFALVASALLGAFALGVSSPASAGEEAGVTAEAPHGHHHERHGQGHLYARALALPSLNNGQRAQVQALADEARAQHAAMHAVRAKTMEVMAGQVERGSIDRNATNAALKAETDAVVASRLRERSIEERLHVVLTAAQCNELGGGKDFLRPAHSEAEIREHAEKRAAHQVTRLEEKLPKMSAEERAQMAARMRAHAGR